MIKRIYYKIKYLYYKTKFKKFGYASVLRSPMSLGGTKNISIGKCTFIGYNAWLAAVPHTGQSTCELTIGDNCSIGNFNHIYATGKIVIEDYVLTADKIYISDNLHGYEDVTIPIKLQKIVQKNSVVIGYGSWIGENVCILGCSIGKQSVIGSNSVVTKSIPDYCVAVGNPAKIIKRYCLETKQWKKTNPDGDFIN
ncbi:acyltransferase [Ferruginibacter yonginensis]|uniref:Acyltransferase n=1 Tax=Ferruginibacter yonginensis TaxID=1310416 RepID=A0ABV8QS63_9BACT